MPEQDTWKQHIALKQRKHHKIWINSKQKLIQLQKNENPHHIKENHTTTCERDQEMNNEQWTTNIER